MDEPDLTPIRVRGKRASHIVHQDNKSGTSTRGGFMKRPEDLMNKKPRRPPQTQAVRPKSSKLKTGRTRAPLHLENLPIEILEQIFAWSLNPSLSEASPLIGCALSSERIYRAFMLFAFFKDASPEPQSEDDIGYVAHTLAYLGPFPVATKAFRPIEYHILNDEERIHLQIAIMERKWFTLERFKSMLPQLLELSWNQQHTYLQLLRKRLLDETKVKLPGSAALLSKLEPPPPISIAGWLDRSQTWGDQFPLRMPALARHELIQALDGVDDPFHFSWRPASYCHAEYVPIKLLQRCNDSDKALDFLCLIQETTMSTPKVFPAALTRAIEGAVQSINIPALQVLLYVLSYRLSYLSRICIPPTIYQAATELPSAKDQKTVLELLCLMPVGRPTIPRDHPALTRWVVHALSEDGDNTFAQALGKFMEDSAQYYMLDGLRLVVGAELVPEVMREHYVQRPCDRIIVDFFGRAERSVLSSPP